MMRYALISPQNVVNRIQPSSVIDPTVQTRPGWKWLPIVDGVPVSVDSLTEFDLGASYTINVNNVVETFSKRNLTAQEISDRKDSVIEANSSGDYPLVWKALFNLHNRVRVLEGQATNTVNQFKTALKTLL